MWSPVTSREHPEPHFLDRTHPVYLDRTHLSVRCNTLGYAASASSDRTHHCCVRSHFDLVSGHFNNRARACQLHLKLIGRCSPESGHYVTYVRSLFHSDNHLLYFTNFSTLAQMCQTPPLLHSDNHLLYFTYFSTLAQMCQTPSVSPCVCVLAYFHKHFQGCWLSTRS